MVELGLLSKALNQSKRVTLLKMGPWRQHSRQSLQQGSRENLSLRTEEEKPDRVPQNWHLSTAVRDKQIWISGFTGQSP